MAMILDQCVTDTTLAVARERALENVHDLWDAVASDARTTHRTLRVESTRFGTLEVQEEIVITFPEGLIGFEECRRYVVVRHDENSAFRWLQALDTPAVAFPIIEPNQIRPDYAPTIGDADARALELDPNTPTLLFAVVTVPPSDPKGMTVNLLAPLVINALTRQGKQVIVQDETYTTRHAIVEELARAAQTNKNRPVVVKTGNR
jgi:flagellar assembly factor FliW